MRIIERGTVALAGGLAGRDTDFYTEPANAQKAVEAIWDDRVTRDDLANAGRAAVKLGAKVTHATVNGGTTRIVVKAGWNRTLRHIIVDKTLPLWQTRFEIARAVGHLIAADLEPGTDITLGSVIHFDADPVNEFAHHFALALLLPGDTVREALNRGYTREQIGDQWVVNAKHVQDRLDMIHRIEGFEVLSEEEHMRLKREDENMLYKLPLQDKLKQQDKIIARLESMVRPPKK